VFENHTTSTGRKIDLNIVVIPAIHKNRKNPPIFYFDGGPGVAATNSTTFFADSLYGYRKEHDIVLVDVRGTGRSHPLHCRQLQYKEKLGDHFDEMYPIDAVKSCYDSLSKIADLTQYTTSNMAIDIEEVRTWLGYEKINLFGLSFGTRLAQVYMKMYPESVKSCVLWSPTTTSSKMPLYHAQFADESLEKLFKDCQGDSLCSDAFPDLRNEFQELMRRGREKPFEYSYTTNQGTTAEISIPWFAFHTKMRSLMYVPFGLRQIPFLIHQSWLGNWEPFLSLFPDTSSYDDFLADGLYLCVTCTEDVPFITSQEVEDLTYGTSMGDYRVRQQQNACSHWAKGTVPAGYFEPLTSDLPVLIFSGYFDPVTPPSMAQEILDNLANGILITIPAMSHLFDGLSNPECFDNIVLEFFSNPSARPDSECITDMLPGPYQTHQSH
jgi:pimeloyl-ACP methyl ester carboxylesterase